MKKRPRIAFVTPNPAPYRLPLFEKLGKEAGIDFRVFFLFSGENIGRGNWQIPQDADFEYEICKTFLLPTQWKAVKLRDKRGLRFSVDLGYRLFRFKPDVVILPEFGPVAVNGVLFAKLLRIKAILWTAVSIEGSRQIESQLRVKFRKNLSRLYDAACVYGQSGKRYLEKLGFDGSKVFFTPTAADKNIFFKAKEKERTDWRTEFGFTKQTYLFVGRLVPLKGVDLLIDAWIDMPKVFHEANQLAFVGEGELQTSLQQKLDAAKLENVRFFKSVPPKELARFYNAADIFFFPTFTDMWGIVVNEAMMCGRPVACSIHAAAKELIVEGQTGWLFDPQTDGEIRAMLKQTQENATDWEAMGKRAMAEVARMNHDTAAEGFLKAVDFVLGRR